MAGLWSSERERRILLSPITAVEGGRGGGGGDGEGWR